MEFGVERPLGASFITVPIVLVHLSRKEGICVTDKIGNIRHDFFFLRFCNGMQLAIAFGANKKFGGRMNKKKAKKKRRFRTGKAIRVLLVSSSDLTRDSN